MFQEIIFSAWSEFKYEIHSIEINKIIDDKEQVKVIIKNELSKMLVKFYSEELEHLEEDRPIIIQIHKQTEFYPSIKITKVICINKLAFNKFESHLYSKGLEKELYNPSLLTLPIQFIISFKILHHYTTKQIREDLLVPYLCLIS